MGLSSYPYEGCNISVYYLSLMVFAQDALLAEVLLHRENIDKPARLTILWAHLVSHLSNQK